MTILVNDIKPTEYFCKSCKQLRLSLNEDKSKCHNCNSTNIVTGKVGELNKEQLLKSLTPAPQDT